tara:strand:+ start:2750 stop:4066 length:1317 start_codon:yes stop_codon:yes gene_type:complete
MSIYDKVDDENKQLIIKFGEIIYLNLNLHLKNKGDIIQMFSNDIDVEDKLKKAFETGENISKLKIDYYKTQYELIESNNIKFKSNLQQEYHETVTDLKNIIFKKECKIDELLQNNQENYDKGLLEGKQCNNMLLNEKIELLKNKNELIEVYRPKQYDNNKEKGDFVENIISDELVRKIDKLSYVIDTSDIKGSGDKIIVFPDYKLMVECKNKTVIKKSDIDQFKDHYLLDLKQNKYDASIFISYNCEYILGKGSFKIEEYEDHVIGYLGLQSDMSDKLKNNIIEYYVSIINDIYTNKYIEIKKNDNIRNFFVKSILDIQEDILSIEKYELPLIDNIKVKYENKKSKLIDLLNQLEKNNIPIPLEIQSINYTDDIFIDKIINNMKPDYILQKQNWKKQLITDLFLNEFYQKFLNKKGITRCKIIEKFNYMYNKNKIINY